MNDKIVELQSAIRTTEEKITANAVLREKTAEVLADTKKEIASVEKSAPASIAAQIETRRQDLAAEIALGTKTSKDAEAFEKEAAKAIAKYESEAARQKAAEPLRAAAAGLQRKLSALEAERVALEAERKAAWISYLRELAEEAGAEYRTHAEKAFGPLLRVVNIGAAIHRLEGFPNAIGLGAREFCAPPIGTASTALPPRDKFDIGRDENLFSIVSDANLAKHVAPDEVALYEEFKAAGLEWPGPPLVVKPVPAPVVEPAAVRIEDVPAAKPIKLGPGAATPVNPRDPDALRGPGWLTNDRPTQAVID